MISERRIDYAEARGAVEAIVAEIVRRGRAAVVAVADSHGELLALARMDGAPVSSLAIAMNKAYSAARERKPSKQIGSEARDPHSGFDIAYFGDARFTGWGGGVPVVVDGQVVGAVAVSGLPESEDMELAALGVRTITS